VYIPFNALTTRVRLASGSDHILTPGVIVGDVITPPSWTDDRHVVAMLSVAAVTSSANGIRSAARLRRAVGDMLAPATDTASWENDKYVNRDVRGHVTLEFQPITKFSSMMIFNGTN